MTRLLMGVETEYAVSGTDSEGSVLEVQEVAEALIRAAKNSLVHLPGNEPGIFCGNGARLYLDCGAHPEYSTPECGHPWELVRHIEAGHRILEDLARIAVEETGTSIAKVSVFRGNVDYSGTGSVWGNHESYAHKGSTRKLAEQIIPHLVSRIVFTGAGGFVSSTRTTGFTLSPRAHHLTSVMSGSSTSDRGIFHLKNESLAGPGFRRLHILCGESVCSHSASLLRIGTTALIVALIDADRTPGATVGLKDPLAAMQAIALDPTCREKVVLASGTRMTAVEIQRVYLEAVEAQLGSDILPAWAPEICARWRAMLDSLENSVASLAGTLDWRIKEELYRDHAAKAGFDLADLAREPVAFLEKSLFPAAGLNDSATDYARLRHAIHRWRRGGGRQLEMPSPNPSSGDPKFQRLVAELFHTDMVFAQVGPAGIFSALESAGVLEHRAEGVDRIVEAMTEPPAAGRARLRGNAVRKLVRLGRKGTASWVRVTDPVSRQTLDLKDPFEDSENWVVLPSRTSRTSRAVPRSERPQRDLLDLMQSLGL